MSVPDCKDLCINRKSRECVVLVAMLHRQGAQSNLDDENSALTIIRSKTPLPKLPLQSGLGSGLPDRIAPSIPTQSNYLASTNSHAERHMKYSTITFFC
jgi:hypothetical protein